jgi:hypothetical protein
LEASRIELWENRLLLELHSRRGFH